MFLSSRPPARSEPPKSVGLVTAWRRTTRPQRFFIFAWCVALIVPSIVMFRMLTEQQGQNRQAAIDRHIARMSTTTAASRTDPERTPPPGHENDVPITVETGVYLDRIPELSIVGSSWIADFYIWFTWQGDLTPGETFKVVNGDVTSRTLIRKSDQGNSHYALYRAVAQITKAFDVARFPRDDHMLTISIEDQALQSFQLKFETDPSTSDYSSRVAISGYTIKSKEVVIKPHAYKSTMGDHALPQGYRSTFSQFTFGVSIERPSWAPFVKMFLALFISTGLSLAGLILRSGPERLALGGTALFVAIMNAETITPLIPDTGISTLADVISGVGYVAIGALIAQAIVYHRWFEDPDVRPEAALIFDVVTGVIVGVFYCVMNIGVVMAASS
jgi:hypothetical protein